MKNLARTDQTQSLNGLFEQMFERPFTPQWHLGQRWLDDTWLKMSNLNAATNVYETDTEYVVEYKTAGIPQEKWDIEVKDDIIFIKAENETNNEENDEEKKYYKMTFNSVKINEKYKIPKNSDASKILANYKDGVLKITMPKIEDEKHKETTKIEVTS